MTASVKRWFISEADMANLSPRKARDLIVDCFFEAQRETFARAKEKAGSSDTAPESIRTMVAAGVRTAFKEAGDDYDDPTVESLERAVAVLARRAAAWGTPTDIIEHHGAQIAALLARLRLGT